MDFAAALQRRMLLGYLGVLLVLYLSSVASAWGMSSVRGEIISVALCVVGLALAARAPLGRLRYGLAVTCLCAVPVAAMLFHDVDAAQVWAVVPLMFSAIFVRAWHRPATARVVATAIAVAAGVALVVAPADVPVQWCGMFAVCILAGAEIVGVLLAALYDAALRDPLTGAWNRTGLERRASELMSRAARRAESLAVIALDIDDFKVLNDSAGHAAGDRVLAQLVRDWRGQLPDQAVVGRLGGDEFVVVVAGHDDTSALALAQRLAAGGPVQVSAGIAVGQPLDARTLEALIARADGDLYRVKRERKRAS